MLEAACGVDPAPPEAPGEELGWGGTLPCGAFRTREAPEGRGIGVGAPGGMVLDTAGLAGLFPLLSPPLPQAQGSLPGSCTRHGQGRAPGHSPRPCTRTR